MAVKIRQWQGEDVTYRHILVEVKENKEKPLYWYNYEVDMSTSANGIALIPAIEIITKRGSVFRIANHFGIGVYKLRRRGYPDVAHFSFTKECKTSESTPVFENELFEHFAHEQYSEYEAGRRKWQKKNFPIDFANSERLRKLINKQ